MEKIIWELLCALSMILSAYMVCYSMVGGVGCLIVASHRQSTAGRYPASGHYQATKARRYVAMATFLETVTLSRRSALRAQHRRNINNQGFGVCFCYKS